MNQPTFSPLAGVEARPAAGGHYAVVDQGAHVLSWQPPGQRPVLWTSRLARFEPGVAIRGGVPVVFPWFAAGALGNLKPSHGFARTATWHRGDVVDTTGSDGSLAVTYHLDHSVTGQLAAFPHRYQASLAVRFAPDALEVGLEVTNTGEHDLPYECALHTYLAVGDISQVRVDGLDGVAYLDTVPGASPRLRVQEGPVRFTGETDRLYDHSGEVVVDDPAWGRRLRVAKQGSATTVVWNPWVAKAAAMADFGDEEWTSMLCIEAANLRDDAVLLAPGERHRLSQSISLT